MWLSRKWSSHFFASSNPFEFVPLIAPSCLSPAGNRYVSPKMLIEGFVYTYDLQKNFNCDMEGVHILYAELLVS